MVNWVKALLLVATLLLSATPPASAAPPANDDFADAQTMTTDVAVAGTNAEATLEPGEPPIEPDRDHTVWYVWTPETSGVHTFITCGSSFDPLVMVYTGTELTSLEPWHQTSADSCESDFSASEGQTYRIQVASPPSSATGGFSLEIERRVPLNDDFADAVVVSGAEGSVQYATANATKEPGEPEDHGSSVWYRWTAPQTGFVAFWCPPTLPSWIPPSEQPPGHAGVYTGSSLTALTRVTFDMCPRAFHAQAGTTYHIAVMRDVFWWYGWLFWQPVGLTAAPTAVALGTQAVGTIGPSHEVTFTNPHATAMALGALRIEGPHANDVVPMATTCFEDEPTSANFAPGESCTVRVRFAPEAVGSRSATLVLPSRLDGARVDNTVPLTGTGAPTPTSTTGAQGPAGTDGTDGQDGQPGPSGPAGPTGQPGPAGPQGAPGRDATVRCRPRVTRTRRIRVLCRVTHVTQARLSALVLRRGRTVGVDRGRVRGGEAKFRLTPRRLRAGRRYTLVVVTRGGRILLRERFRVR